MTSPLSEPEAGELFRELERACATLQRLTRHVKAGSRENRHLELAGHALLFARRMAVFPMFRESLRQLEHPTEEEDRLLRDRLEALGVEEE